MPQYPFSNTAQWKLVAFCIYIYCLNILPAVSQTTSYQFRHLTNSEGLSDGVVHGFSQDHFGYIWIATSHGLNRFDGIEIKGFFSKTGDSTSLLNNFVQSVYCDSKQRLWVGTYSGLCRYDYSTNRFIRYSSSRTTLINDILEDVSGQIWLATDDGLWTVNEKATSIERFTNNNNQDYLKKFQCLTRQIVASPDGTWYLATVLGVKIFNPMTKAYGEIIFDTLNNFSISDNAVISVALDSSGFLWASCTYPQALLNKIDLKNHTVRYYDHFIKAQKNWNGNVIQKILTDTKGRVWVTATVSGLSLYDPQKDDFRDYKNDPYIPTSLLFNTNISIYQSRDGIIWLGTPGYGLSYFNPDKNFFYSVYPFINADSLIAETWCRAASEDHKGNIWLATGKGVAVYDNNWSLIKTFSNVEGKKPKLYVNSVRSILLDDSGDMWIGTAKGLNRYHSSTGDMEFYNDNQGIPLSFFWMMAKDTGGEIWIGSVSGLFHYLKNENKFDNLRSDPVLSKYAYNNIQALYADNHNRLWIGMLNVGLGIYDINQKKLTILTIKDSLITDTRFSSMAEDQDGIIWIGSEDGLTAYDPATHHSRFFTRENGLPSNRTNNIMVDSLNRVWISTSNGLCVLNAARNNFKRFDVNDGLLTNQFNEQSAFRTTQGLFIYPTYKGFLVFHPEAYRENSTGTPLYITSFKISDKELSSNTETLKQIKLRHNQNFFSIALAGLNYMNPYQCMYAYKLDPFDLNWIITRKREINYTNVPAGDYTFRYKVITDNPDWNVPEKTIDISIATIYYETWWFRSIALLLLASVITAFFRYRLNYRENLLVLKNKAQLLEKEKTLVMYENLKQHLNPHFLFNSLTSLSSLIMLDQKVAGDFLDKMSKVYRYILKNRENETVPLSEELKFVDLYNQLQITRFENGLKVNVQIDEEYYNRKIAPVTLQNLVENAIKHNIANADSPLVIDLYIEDEYLVVRNNLQRKSFVETSNKQGLSNMLSLYYYLSSRPMEIKENGKYFTVKIPLL